jgi:hypothetical protein
MPTCSQWPHDNFTAKHHPPSQELLCPECQVREGDLVATSRNMTRPAGDDTAKPYMVALASRCQFLPHPRPFIIKRSRPGEPRSAPPYCPASYVPSLALVKPLAIA